MNARWVCVVSVALAAVPIMAGAVSPNSKTYTDSRAFCAAVGTTQKSVSHKTYPAYVGVADPAWMHRAMQDDPSSEWKPTIEWRCSNGRVLACEPGMSGMNAMVCFRDKGKWQKPFWTDITDKAS